MLRGMRRGIQTNLAWIVTVLALLMTGCGKADGRPNADPTSATSPAAVTTATVPPTTLPDQSVVSTTTSTTVTATTTTTSVPIPLPDIDADLDEFDDLESLLDELDDLLADL